MRRSGELALSVLGALSDTSVLVFDRDLRYVLAAGQALQAHGYDAAQLEGRRLADFMSGQALDRLTTRYQAALKGERTRFEHQTADATRIYDIEVAPIVRDGKIIGGLAISRDITERKATERALARSAREFRDLAEQASDVVTRTGEDARYTYVSPSSEAVYGRRPDEMLGHSTFEFLHPDDHEVHRRIRASFETGVDEDVVERRVTRPDGSWVWVEAHCRALRDETGRLTGVQTAARDISGRKAAEDARRIADDQFRTAFDDALIGIALVSPDGSWLRVNDALCDIVGYTREQLMNMTFQDVTHPDDLDADLALVAEVLSGERSGYQMEKRYLRSDGEEVSAILSVSLVRDGDGAPLHFISQVQDISERARLELELRRLATRDDLTGLYNRRFFERELAQQLGLLGRQGGPAAVLFLDLDEFKTVNDTYGHQAGDELLKHVAAVLRGRLRDTDVIARLGGDEFAVLLPLTDAEPAGNVVDALQSEFAQRPANIDGTAIPVRASIGVAALDADLDVDAALRRADQAMYRVKRSRAAL
ncbi:MAG TPA: PAS domain S-box protein [Solirubrobacteraceae bacterium]|nr:PAS domain S-box protein [Solirubrobacteraceae bacterium]